ncbi:glycosyltransferase family 4 protein [Mesoflavibacter zeaxanthinifaciens]
MYPSSKDPLFGVFVKNFKLLLEKHRVIFSAVSVIKGKRDNKFSKLFSYSIYYISISYNYFFKEYDLLYVHYLSHNSPILALLLLKKRKPLVINVHGTDIFSSQGKKIDQVNVHVLKKTDLIVVPSLYFQNIMLINYPFLKPYNIFVSPSAGVDMTKFYLLPPNINATPILGLISRIDAGKGWEDFLSALNILKNRGIKFKAIIAGQGLEEKQMLTMINNLNLSEDVEFLGLVKQNQLVHLYNKMDAMVFPTKKEESLGLVGLEAMSCKTPVIGSDIAGLKTYIKHNENGLLFTPGNVNELAENIEKYLKFSAEKKKEMMEAAYATSQEYEAKRVISNLHNRLLELCTEK